MKNQVFNSKMEQGWTYPLLFPNMTKIFFGTEGIEKLSQWLETHQDSCPVVGNNVRLGAPLARPSKIVCVGLNYAKHAEESGMAAPEEPVLFF